MEDELSHPILNERQNIIVITDEAHRSQYGFSQKSTTKDNTERVTPSIYAVPCPMRPLLVLQARQSPLMTKTPKKCLVNMCLFTILKMR